MITSTRCAILDISNVAPGVQLQDVAAGGVRGVLSLASFISERREYAKTL